MKKQLQQSLSNLQNSMSVKELKQQQLQYMVVTKKQSMVNKKTKQIMKSQIRFLYQRYVQILRLKMKDAIFHDVGTVLEQYGVYPSSTRNCLAFDK